jgi:hypothetical protein
MKTEIPANDTNERHCIFKRHDIELPELTLEQWQSGVTRISHLFFRCGPVRFRMNPFFSIARPAVEIQLADDRLDAAWVRMVVKAIDGAGMPEDQAPMNWVLSSALPTGRESSCVSLIGARQPAWASDYIHQDGGRKVMKLELKMFVQKVLLKNPRAGPAVSRQLIKTDGLVDGEKWSGLPF